LSNKKGFEILEHTADEFLMAYGTTLEEAFESAALAMFEVMIDTSTIEPKEEVTLEVNAEDEESLLYSWLEKLLITFEIDGKIFSKFNVQRIEKMGNSLILNALVWGELYNPTRHTTRRGIKAITYHRMQILKEEKKTTVKFVLDI